MQRGNGSWGVAAETIASLNCGDDALEVSAVEQLGELQEAMAQDEELEYKEQEAQVSASCDQTAKSERMKPTILLQYWYNNLWLEEKTG